MLQHLKFQLDRKVSLFASADHPYFYNKGIFDLAEEWVVLGGKYLIIDEVHKLERWSNELKVVYDSFPDLKIIFSSSSALNIYQGEGDLSRRLSLYELSGLSFREYISFQGMAQLPSITLGQLVTDHQEIATEWLKVIKPIPLFREYLRVGYFPFSRELDEVEYLKRLIAVLNTVLEVDLAHAQSYSVSNTAKVKRLLGTIAELVPYEPNISSLASKLGLGRNTVLSYLQHLQDAKILNAIYHEQKGVAGLQKPSKIYLENTNLSYALRDIPEMGNLRETFVLSQVRNMNLDVQLPKKGDFLVDNQYLFEVGGRNKTRDQIKDFPNGYLLKDDVEIGFDQSIPLWMIGFLY